MGPSVAAAALTAQEMEVVVVGHCHRDHCMLSVVMVQSDGSCCHSCCHGHYGLGVVVSSVTVVVMGVVMVMQMLVLVLGLLSLSWSWLCRCWGHGVIVGVVDAAGHCCCH